MTNLIAEKVKKHFSKMENQIRLYKDIQWEYQLESDKWKPFSLFVNSLIETAYLKKELTVN